MVCIVPKTNQRPATLYWRPVHAYFTTGSSLIYTQQRCQLITDFFGIPKVPNIKLVFWYSSEVFFCIFLVFWHADSYHFSDIYSKITVSWQQTSSRQMQLHLLVRSCCVEIGPKNQCLMSLNRYKVGILCLMKNGFGILFSNPFIFYWFGISFLFC